MPSEWQAEGMVISSPADLKASIMDAILKSPNLELEICHPHKAGA